MKHELLYIGYWNNRDQYAVVTPEGQQICVLSCASDDDDFEGDHVEALAEMLRYGVLIVEGLNSTQPHG